MTHPNTDFQTIMALSAASLIAQNREHKAARSTLKSYLRWDDHLTERLAEAGVFLGVSVVVSVMFVAQSTPVAAEAPQIWTHGLLALTIAQGAILAGASCKVFTRIERIKNTSMLKSRPTDRPSRRAYAQLREVSDPSTLAISSVMPAGNLSGRPYTAFADGSVEIDTLLGRRRFIHLEAAREFVGE